MTNNKSVCMVSYRLPGEHSGAATQAHTLAEALVRKGLSVTLLGASTTKVQYKENSGVTIIGLKSRLTGRYRIDTKIFTIRLLSYLIIHKREYDLVHYHGLFSHCFYYGILLGKAIGLPSLIKLSLVGFDDPVSVENSFFGSAKIRILNTTAGVIAISPSMSSEIKKSSLEVPVFEVPNGVDTGYFKPCREKERKKIEMGLGGLKVVSFVGGINPRKGLLTLIGAWKLVVDKADNSILLIIGPWDKNPVYKAYYYGLKKQIAKYNIEKSVRFLGQIDNVKDYLQASDLFVFPTKQEGLPNALLEALSCGVPSVVSFIPGITDALIVHGENGYLVDNLEDANTFCKHISRLLSEKSIRTSFGETARNSILYMDINETANKYIAIYEKIVSYSAPPSDSKNWDATLRGSNSGII